jgi:hypothetical protein
MADKTPHPFLRAAAAGHIPSLERGFGADSKSVADAVSAGARSRMRLPTKHGCADGMDVLVL